MAGIQIDTKTVIQIPCGTHNDGAYQEVCGDGEGCRTCSVGAGGTGGGEAGVERALAEMDM